MLEELIKLRQSIVPDLVLIPSGSDLHQDHQVVHNEGLRAFKQVSIWGYELPWNHISFDTQAFIPLEQHHIDTKWKMMQAYDSQFEKQRAYFNKEFIVGLARVRGVQVSEDFAEAFEVKRLKL